MRQAFINATLWTSAGPPIEGGTLLVEDGRIVDVGTEVETSGADIVDCRGKYLLPGFVDAHVHTGIAGEGAKDDWDTNETSEAITPHVRTLDSIYPEDPGFDDARRGGVTTLGIMHGSANPIGGQLTVVKARGLVVDEMVLREPAGVKMALGENPKRVGEQNKRAPNTRMGAAYLARKAFVEAIEYRKDWEHHRTLLAIEEAKPEAERKALREPKRDLGKEVLLRVLDGEIPVRNHCHRIDDIRTAIRLSEEFGYRLVLDHATESWRMPSEIASRNIPLAIGPLYSSKYKREVNRRTPATVGIMVEAGAMVAIITDSPVNEVHALRDLVILAIREGLSEDRALETVTVNPARILEVDDRVGSLEPGKDADFLVFPADPWDGRTKVEATYIDGRQVFEATGPYLPN
ncbi:MAG TPA: amidohydrolase [Acidimicrobiia bacterium]|nr:amidohydrolase [Acidimicrobiia bacterium]